MWADAAMGYCITYHHIVNTPLRDKIKMIEESPDPDNFKDEEIYFDGDKEEYLLVDKKLTQEKESLLNEVRLLQEE